MASFGHRWICDVFLCGTVWNDIGLPADMSKRDIVYFIMLIAGLAMWAYIRR